MRNKWTESVRTVKPDSEPTAYSYLCSTHFTPDDYTGYRVQQSDSENNTSNRLKKNVIPTVFRNESEVVQATNEENIDKLRLKVRNLQQTVRRKDISLC